MDDVVVFGENQEEHDRNLQEVINRIKEAGLKLNKDKCAFSEKSIEFLGHKISKDGIRISPEKITAIMDLNAPKDVTELRRILGMINYLTKFLPRAQEILHPLNNLLKKVLSI